MYSVSLLFFFFNDTATTEIYTLSLHDALPISNNYTGAVKRLDAIRQQLAHLDWPTAPVFMINGLKREELIAANSAWLHELYFDTLGGDGALPDSGLAVALARDFEIGRAHV